MRLKNLSLFLFLIFLLGCGRNNESKIIGIEIEGQEIIKEGYHTKLNAIVTYENGDKKIESANWSSSNPESLSVNNGIIKGEKISKTVITAEKNGVIGTKNIEVIESLKCVTIEKTENYYSVTVDYNLFPNITPTEFGEEYSVIIKKKIPNFEVMLEAYIIYCLNAARGQYSLTTAYEECLKRVNDIKPKVPFEYQQELIGIATQFSAFGEDKIGDGKISLNELYIYNMITDVVRGTECSAISVYGSKSETGKNIIGRNLDWSDGDILCKFASIMTIKKGDNSICLIGYLAHMGLLSGFNKSGVFAAILDSSTSEKYSSIDKKSYSLDLRYALQNFRTMEEITEYMTKDENKYSYSHLIFIGDKNRSGVIENNISQKDYMRKIRWSDSELNENIEWGVADSVGAVNCFLLKGNYDNYTNNMYSINRWRAMREQLKSKGEKVTREELKEIITFDNGDGPGDWRSGDLYNDSNLYTLIYEPDTMELEVSYKPLNGDDRPDDPLFNKVVINFN